MDWFAEFTEHFLPTNKTLKQSTSTPLLRSKVRARINKIYDFMSLSGLQNCDCAANKIDIAGFLKNNANSNSKQQTKFQKLSIPR